MQADSMMHIRPTKCEAGSSILECVVLLAALAAFASFALEVGVFAYANVWADAQSLAALRDAEYAESNAASSSESVQVSTALMKGTCTRTVDVASNATHQVLWHVPAQTGFSDALYQVRYRLIQAKVSLSYRPLTIWGSLVTGGENLVATGRYCVLEDVVGA